MSCVGRPSSGPWGPSLAWRASMHRVPLTACADRVPPMQGEAPSRPTHRPGHPSMPGIRAPSTGAPPRDPSRTPAPPSPHPSRTSWERQSPRRGTSPQPAGCNSPPSWVGSCRVWLRTPPGKQPTNSWPSPSSPCAQVSGGVGRTCGKCRWTSAGGWRHSKRASSRYFGRKPTARNRRPLHHQQHPDPQRTPQRSLKPPQPPSPA